MKLRMLIAQKEKELYLLEQELKRIEATEEFLHNTKMYMQNSSLKGRIEQNGFKIKIPITNKKIFRYDLIQFNTLKYITIEKNMFVLHVEK